jgi:UDP:flavonoid glycosyltransferase YjiC (YdhE family)
MRILISTTRGAGHFGPLIPFAKAFLRHGHEVLVTAATSAAPMIARAGLDHWPFADPPDDRRDAIFQSVRELSDLDAGKRVVGDVFVRIDARVALPGVAAAIRSWRPDVVLYESNEYAAPLAAERAGIPAVLVSVFLGAEDVVQAAATEPINELRAELGLLPDPRGDRLRSAPTFTLAPEAVGYGGGVAHVQRFREPTGPRRALPAWWRNQHWPLVYITFGSVVPTLEYYPTLYRAAIDAVAPLPVNVLVTVGRDRDPADLGPLPPNVHATRWMPQGDVLHHAAAVVCHGGSGTVLGALAAGVPLAVLPMFADQTVNARGIAQMGVGIALDAPADLTGAVRRLLDEPGYREAAQAVAAEVRELPPVDVAVGIVDELVAYSQPRSVA